MHAMAIKSSLVLGLLVLASSLALSAGDAILNRYSFPDGFVFGSSTSAYQIEGHPVSNGKGPSVWDTFVHQRPEMIVDRSTGDVAIDFIRFYKEDVARMKEMNMDAYRFSIAWSRVLPHGQLKAGVNPEGIKFYSDLIDEILANGMQPYVTLFHWDTPQSLEDKYGSFLSRNIIKDFRDYAELCFKEFGHRVKHWITINEPSNYIAGGYDLGLSPPARCSSWVNRLCRSGNSATEPYTATHNMLLAHAAAVNVYRTKYQKTQNGSIGLSLVSGWYEPQSNNLADHEAAKRYIDFQFGWFMDPLVYGEYPRSMRDKVGNRLPTFTEEEVELVKGSYDFIGINYYTSSYAANVEYVPPTRLSYSNDMHVTTSTVRDGKLIGPQVGVAWMYVYPDGIRYLLNYTKDTYMNPKIFITENGIAELNNKSLPLDQALNDTERIDYHRAHLWNALRSVDEYKVDLQGYFAWSYADNFEWNNGYTVRFGIWFVDYDDDLKRYPKASVDWFAKFLNHNTTTKSP